MKIIVKAKANAKKELIERVTQQTLGLEKESGPDVYKISVKEPPIDGRANNAIIKALSKYFNVPQSCVVIMSGQTSKTKMFDVNI